ncbi:MAG: hypothetical protein A3H91_05815 [Gammaproteobacteria bacterium RIFCSPLOWO2_02_FULL_61_13]|nr:MAG: hypothetical protein A3H91_05815 [Gammaproteobacteria bacterium RIFCSPLOWO2_02_FULL_61_13]
MVTLEGEFLRNRLAAAILRRIDVTETIAADLDQYVELVARLAQEPTWRAELRRRILEHLPRAYEDKSVIQFLEDFLGEFR